jgi:hypothetical protein
LMKTKKHEFRIKSGDKKPIKIKTKDTLWKRSPLLVSSRRVAAINNRIIKDSGCYKPILPNNKDLDWLEDLPEDRRDRELEETCPTPRFKL